MAEISLRYIRQRTVNETSTAMQKDIGGIYQKPFINWRGKTKDEHKQYFTEIIAEELLRLDIVAGLQDLSTISRERYSVDTHDGVNSQITNREEDILNKDHFTYCKRGDRLGKLGTIFDYQVPLKRSGSDKAGRIDLVSFNDENNKIWLLELKRQDNEDTLLRCVLEIATYYQLLDQRNFINSYNILSGIKPDDIRKAVLVFKESSQHQEINEMKDGKRPMLKKLSEAMGVPFFLLEGTSLDFSVEKIAL